MLKFFAGFIFIGYLAGLGAVAVSDQVDHPEQTIAASIEEGIMWPKLLVNIMNQP